MIDHNNINPVLVRSEVNSAFGQFQSVMPEKVREELATVVVQGPVEVLVHGVEALYAFMKSEGQTGEVVEAVAPIVGRAAYLIAQANFYGRSTRGIALLAAARRALGEDVPGDDPAIDPKFDDQSAEA